MNICQYCNQKTSVLNRLRCNNKHQTAHCSSCLKKQCKLCLKPNKIKMCDFCKINPQNKNSPCQKHKICKTCSIKYYSTDCCSLCNSQRIQISKNTENSKIITCSKGQHKYFENSFEKCPYCPDNTNVGTYKCSKCSKQIQEAVELFICDHKYCLNCLSEQFKIKMKCPKCSCNLNTSEQNHFYQIIKQIVDICYGCYQYSPKIIGKQVYTCNKCNQINCRLHESLLNKCICSSKNNKDNIFSVLNTCSSCQSMINKTFEGRCGYCCLSQ